MKIPRPLPDRILVHFLIICGLLAFLLEPIYRLTGIRQAAALAGRCRVEMFSTPGF